MTAFSNIDWSQVKPAEETEDWAYYPKLFSAIKYKDIYDEIFPHCTTYTNKIYGKVYEARRISCVVGDNHYGELATVDWTAVKTVSALRNLIEDNLMPKYEISDQSGSQPRLDYVLSHIYRNGKDTLGYHADRESLHKPVISITFAPLGITRKFRFRKVGETCGYVKEYQLGHGDLLIMKRYCQQRYKHSVPVESDVNQSRINFTFRYHDSKGVKNPTKSKTVIKAQQSPPTGPNKIPLKLKSPSTTEESPSTTEESLSVTKEPELKPTIKIPLRIKEPKLQSN